jgi:hypothetical protein
MRDGALDGLRRATSCSFNAPLLRDVSMLRGLTFPFFQVLTNLEGEIKEEWKGTQMFISCLYHERNYGDRRKARNEEYILSRRHCLGRLARHAGPT